MWDAAAAALEVPDFLRVCGALGEDAAEDVGEVFFCGVCGVVVSCVLLRNLLDIGTSSAGGVGGDGFTGFADTASTIVPSSGESVLFSARGERGYDFFNFTENHIYSYIQIINSLPLSLQ